MAKPTSTYHPVKVSQHGESCIGSCCSGFYGDEHISTNGLDRDGLLTNEIHPLFADEQFHGNHDLSEILLVRRFASRLLERPELMPFFYNMFFGRKTQMFEFNSTGNPQWRLPAPPTSLTAQQIADTKGRLLALQKCFYFEIDSSLPRNNARTHALPNEPAPEPFTGVKSKICISPLDIHELEASDLLAEIMASFSLGNLFHHELSHAVKLAVHGVSTQIFFGDGKVAEEGFEWESRMFGGNLCSYVAEGKYLVDDEQSPLSLHLLLKEWPSEELVNLYISTGSQIGLLRPPGYTCFWKVPFTFFLGVTTDEFWDNEVPRLGASALKAPKIHGILTRTMVDGTVMHIRPSSVPAAILPQRVRVDKDDWLLLPE